jgi:Cu/Ag efflux protein CusF
MNRYLWVTGIALALAGIFVGCKSGGDAKERIWDVKGKVVAVDLDKKKITLDHEDIPGLMSAMKMAFDFEDAKVVEGLKADDPVQGKFKVTDGKYIILELKKR